MKTFCILIVFLAAVGSMSLYAFQQPSVTVNPATPSTIYVNTQTNVTITTQITDSTVISSGVNLLQIDPITGQTLATVGTLHDDGQNGDVVAGDHIFTIVFQPTTTAPTLFMYKVSAAFRGKLPRSLSLPISVAVAPIGVALPPDPGPAGMQTLAGIDSDGDGVRDDVQRWIATTYPNSARLRAGATQYAAALEGLFTAGTDTSLQMSRMSTTVKAINCLVYIDTQMHNGIVPSSQDTDSKVLSEQLNTYERARYYYQLDQQESGTVFGGPAGGDYASECYANIAGLPN